jgi:hypothetical protein
MVRGEVRERNSPFSTGVPVDPQGSSKLNTYYYLTQIDIILLEFMRNRLNQQKLRCGLHGQKPALTIMTVHLIGNLKTEPLNPLYSKSII